MAAVLNPPKSRYLNWADEQDDEPNMPMPLIQLPSGPRASRTFDDDSVPKSGPFLAYLSNLPYDLDEEGLEDFFSKLAIVSVRMPREDGGRSRGYGYVEFETREDLIDAISLPDPTINNRHIRIDVSTESDRKNRGQGRYGDREPLSAGESNWRRGGSGGNADDDRRGGGGGGRDFGGGNSRYSSQAPPRDTNSDWRSGDRPAREYDDGPMRRGGDDRERDGPMRRGGDDRDRDGPMRRGGDDRDRDGGGYRERYGGRRSNYEDRNRDGPGGREASPPPMERPKLQLQPRTLPVEPIVVAKEDEKEAEAGRRSPSPPRPKPVPAANIFGSAKPVDTAAREREIEERLERERQEERRLREEARDKARENAPEPNEGEPQTVEADEEKEKAEDKPKPAVMSWRRQTDDESAPVQRQPNYRRQTSPDGRGPRRDDRREERRGGDDRRVDDRREDRRGDDRRGGGGGQRDDRRAGEYSRGGGGGFRGGDRDRRMDRNE